MAAKRSRIPARSRRSRPPTVGIISRARFYREILIAALGRKLGVVTLDLLDGGRETMERVSRYSPDVVLLDAIPQLLLELVPRIQKRSRSSRIVALAVEGSDRQVVALAEAGIAGFVLRESSLAEMVATVRDAINGELRCSPRVTAALAQRVCTLADRRDGRPNETPLTAREAQVLTLINQALSNKEISTRLSIEVATVKNHVHNILEKLAVHRRGEAARIAGRGIDQP